MHLILNPLEEQPCGRSVLVVVHARSVDVRQLLIEPSLAEPDLPNLSQQVLEVVLTKESPVLHALLVEHIAAYGKLSQHARCPLPELGGTDAVHAVAYGDDGIEAVELRQVFFAI